MRCEPGHASTVHSGIRVGRGRGVVRASIRAEPRRLRVPLLTHRRGCGHSPASVGRQRAGHTARSPGAGLRDGVARTSIRVGPLRTRSARAQPARPAEAQAGHTACPPNRRVAPRSARGRHALRGASGGSSASKGPAVPPSAGILARSRRRVYEPRGSCRGRALSEAGVARLSPLCLSERGMARWGQHGGIGVSVTGSFRH